MAYTKYSLTPANNTAAPPDGAPEGMLPSAVNDTMRDMMAQIRDVGDGVRDGTYTMTAVKITGGTINGATIGATTATTGAFTTINASTSITNAGLTSGRVTFAGASGILTDSAGLTFDGTIFQVKTGNTAATQFRIAHSTVANFYADYTEKGDLTVGRNSWSGGVTTEFSTTSATSTYTGDLAGGFSFKPRGSLAVTIAGNGLVGIGTSSPLSALDVRSANATIGNYQTIQAFTTNTATIDFGGGISLGGYYSSTTSLAQFGTISGRKENATDGNYAGYLQFGTNSQATGVREVMRLDSSGNLGLGVTPSAWNSSYRAFQVSSHISLWGNSGGGALFLANNEEFVGVGTRKYLVTDFATEYVQVSGQHQWKTAPSGTAGDTITFTQAMTLDASGQLSVGTTSAFARLTTSQSPGSAGQVNAQIAMTHAGASTAYFISTIRGAATNEPEGLTFKENATERMRINSSGNVGINIDTPVSKLDVRSTAGEIARFVTKTSAGECYILVGADASTTEGLRLTYDNADGSSTINNFYPAALKFKTNNLQRMSIDLNGIVTMNAYGVGTATFNASGVISSVSDETWKTKDGIPINPDVMLQKLEPGYWFYNDEKKETFSKDRQLGFYAQNVHEAIGAEAAPTPEEGKPWGYYDRSVLAVTVMSLKNALTTIEELKQRITALENK